MKKISLLLLLSLLFVNACKDDDCPTVLSQDFEPKGGSSVTPLDSLYDLQLVDTSSFGIGVNLSPRVDLSGLMPSVGDQHPANSCISWAVGYYLKSFHETVQNGLTGNRDEYLFSPMYLYNQVNGGNCDGLPTVRQTLNVLKKQGVCRLVEMSKDVPCDSFPSKSAQVDAECAQIRNYTLMYHHLFDKLRFTNNQIVRLMKISLTRGQPVVMNYRVDNNHGYNSRVDNYKYTNYNDAELLFHHTCLIVGYDDSENAFKVINSWGQDWGNDGYFWLDYDLVKNVVVEAFFTQDKYENCDNKGESLIGLNDDFDFGLVAAGDKVSKEVTILNSGNIDLEITSVVFPEGFSTQQKTELSIQPGKSAEITIDFSPLETKDYSGEFEIISNSSNSNVDGVYRKEILGFGFIRENLTATNPNPSDNSTRIPISGDLSYSRGEELPVGYYHKVYLDIVNPPLKIVSTQTSKSFNYSELHPLTKYYWKVETYGDGGELLGISDLWKFETMEDNTVTDYDGNVYETVQIGTQVWMKENLKTTHYSNGTAIPQVISEEDWTALADDNTLKAYSWYDNNISNKNTYGALYSYAVILNGDQTGSNVKGPCPNGWHVPNTDDISVFKGYLFNSYGSSSAGGSLKDTSNLWTAPNVGATNATGFSALPSGIRSQGPDTSYFEGKGDFAVFHVVLKATSSFQGTMALVNSGAEIVGGSTSNINGRSCRCIKD